MSNKTFLLFIFMWIAWMMIGMDMVEMDHWFAATLVTLIMLAVTFVTTE